MERVVGDSPGQDRCGGFPSWAGLSVRGLSQELVFLGGALSMGPAVTTGGQPARGHFSEHCSCLRESVWLWALQSECHLDGSCARLLPGTPQDCSAPSAAPTPSAGPGPLAEGLLEMDSELPTSDLQGRVFPMGLDGLNVTSLSLKLDSGWESFLSGGSQLPRCCNLFSCFCREVFFLSSSGCVVFCVLFFLFFFCHQKNTYELCVVVPPTLPHSPTPNCDLPVLTVKSLVS